MMKNGQPLKLNIYGHLLIQFKKKIIILKNLRIFEIKNCY